MNIIHPFIYENNETKEEKFEQISLNIELLPPIEQKEDLKEENNGIIIIDIL